MHSIEERRDLFLGIVKLDRVQDFPWTEKLTINNVPETFTLDTAARANIIPMHVLNKNLTLPFYVNAKRKYTYSWQTNLSISRTDT